MVHITNMALAVAAIVGIAGASIGIAHPTPAAAQGRGGFERGGGGFPGGGSHDRGGYEKGGFDRMNRPAPQRQPMDFSYGRPDRRVYNERPEQWRPSRPSFFGR